MGRPRTDGKHGGARDERQVQARSVSYRRPHHMDMKRDEWKFEYTAARLAEAADAKISHHGERLAFWKAKRDEVLATIRAEGLEIDENRRLSRHFECQHNWLLSEFISSAPAQFIDEISSEMTGREFMTPGRASRR